VKNNPLYTSELSKSVAALGEIGLIDSIKSWLGDVCPPAPAGIGDDCAVFAPAKKSQVVTVDPVIYGRHFDETVAPKDVGAKLLKRNLSDIAAMGARPTIAVVSLAIDRRLRTAWLRQFYQGLASAAREYDVQIVGGDVAESPNSVIATVTQLGIATGRVVTRSGARLDDHIYVTGALGGSILGHHYRFIPRLAEGAWLSKRREVRAMMDLSDGLAKDVRALTPAGCVAAINTAALPVSPAARRLASRSGKSAVDHALTDGEDYELVLAVDGRCSTAAFEQAWRSQFQTRLTRIGQFTRTGKKLETNHVAATRYAAYEHLR
jgi:thiamine-monophosphate kinase